MRYPSRAQLRDAIQLGRRRQQGQAPFVRTIGAPIGGLNGRDSWDAMDELDAIRLDNWLPAFGKVTVRPGSVTHATVGTPGFTVSTLPVETLAEYHGKSERHLLAASEGGVYNVTVTGEHDTALGSGFTNDRWQTANMNDLLLMVNGADAPQQYNGSTLAAMSITREGVLDETKLVGVNVFKSRAYYWAENSQDFEHTAVNAHGGSLTTFPLADVGNFGGFLMTMVTWTRDGGAGMDDLAVFIMSSGDTIVYAGSDPSEANDWALVGVFKIGSPLGRRCAVKIGGDVMIATVDGPVLLSKMLSGGRTARNVNVSGKLGKLLLDQARLTPTDFGWQPFQYPGGRFAWLNYPTGGEFEQFPVNLDTGAWTHLRGWNASCWSLFNDKPYFGAPAGKIIEAWTGVTDDGEDVQAEAHQAFSYLGARNMQKQVQLVSPLLEAAAAVPVRLGLASDFAVNPGASVDASIGTAGGVSTPWGSPWGSPWSSPSHSVHAWLAHSARGYAIAPHLRVAQRDKLIAWNGTRVTYTRAGLI
jgi:hypothetical protein